MSIDYYPTLQCTKEGRGGASHRWKTRQKKEKRGLLEKSISWQRSVVVLLMWYRIETQVASSNTTNALCSYTFFCCFREAFKYFVHRDYIKRTRQTSSTKMHHHNLEKGRIYFIIVKSGFISMCSCNWVYFILHIAIYCIIWRFILDTVLYALITNVHWGHVHSPPCPESLCLLCIPMLVHVLQCIVCISEAWFMRSVSAGCQSRFT